MNNGEVRDGLKLGNLELRMLRVIRLQLLDVRLVGRLRKPALLVEQRENAHRLKNQTSRDMSLAETVNPTLLRVT